MGTDSTALAGSEPAREAAEGTGAGRRFTLSERYRRELKGLPSSRQAKVNAIRVELIDGGTARVSRKGPHKYRVGTGGNDPQRVRREDGAKAWRCSVTDRTPQALRLHWWVLPDGSIEFVSITNHDDPDPFGR